MLLLLFLVFQFLSLFSAPIKVDRESVYNDLYNDIRYVETAPGEYSIQQLLDSPAVLNNFIVPPYGMNFPYPSAAYWFYIDIVNTDTVLLEQILALNNPNLNEIKIFKTISGVIVDSVTTGDSYPIDSSDIAYIDHLFQLELKPNDTMRVFGYVYNHTDEIFIPISLSSPVKFIEENQNLTYYRVLRVGMLLFVIVAMIFLVIVTRTKQSVYFFLYLLFITLFLFHAWGINQQYLWPMSAEMGVRTSPLLITFSILFAQFFNRVFLNTQKNSPLADKIIKVLVWLSLGVLVCQLVPLKYLIIPQGAVVGIAAIAAVATPVYSILCFKNNFRAAIVIFLSAVPIMVTVALFFFRFYGTIEFDSLLLGFDTAFVIELVIIMFGVIDQYSLKLVRSVRKASQVSTKLEEQKLELEHSNKVLKHTIEEKEKMQDKLLQVHKLETIGKLAGGIAHDFNNLLAPIIGYTEMCLDDIDKESELHEDLSVVLRSSLRAKELVNQILTFSKHFKQEAQLVSVAEVVDEVLVLLKSVIPRTVTLKEISDGSTNYTVFADPTQLHQILMNICTNAYHAIGKEKGTITLSKATISLDTNEIDKLQLGIAAGNYVRIEISDTGSGMDKKTVAKIFDPFFTTKETGEGTGLGLSVVHGIIKKLDGAITVSSNVGEGTSFCVYLPLSEELATSDPVAEMQEIVGDGAQIMVVDDEEQVLMVMERLLARSGFSCISFNDSSKALDYFKEHTKEISLLITDQTMPNLQGSELANEVKKIDQTTAVLLVTGYSETVTENNFKNFGIDALMLKPINSKKLLQNVAELIRGSESVSK